MNIPKQLIKAGMVALLAICLTGNARAESRNGASMGLGVGPVVLDGETYPSLRIRFDYDIEAFRLGLSAGYIDFTQDYGDDLTFIPVELTASLMPVRFARPDFILQPYAGIGAGGLIISGNSSKTHGMISPHLGVEFQIGQRHAIGLDFSYHFISGVDNGSLDYFNFTLGYRYRFSSGDSE